MSTLVVPKARRKEVLGSELEALGKPVQFFETVNQARVMAPHMRSLSWSPTGSHVATAIARSIRIWDPELPDVKKSTEIRTLTTDGNIEKLEFCPNYDAVLASIGGDGYCRLYDARTPGAVGGGRGTQLVDCKTGNAGLFMTWHPNGHEVLVGRKDDVVELVDIRRMGAPGVEAQWEATTEEKIIEKDHGQLNGMSFSNTGNELFVTTGDGPVKILDWPSLETLHTLEGHTSATNTVLQSPVGSYIAVGGNDSIVTLWDTSNWYCAHAIMTNTIAVRGLSFSFDGNYVIPSSGNSIEARDSTPGLHVTHVETGEHIVTLDTVLGVSWAAWHPHRYWIAYTGDVGGLKIFGAGNDSL